MRMMVVVVMLLIGCGEPEVANEPDGGVVVPPDSSPGVDFFGENCALPTVTAAVTFCDRPNYAAYCVDEDKNGDLVGTCRPRCDRLHPEWNPEYVCQGSKAGGIPTWTSDGHTPGLPYVCYCAPPR